MEIRDDGTKNPILIISADEVLAFIKAKITEVGYDAGKLAAVQISVEQPFGNGLKYHYEVPQLVAMVSHGSKLKEKAMPTLEQLQKLPQYRAHKIVRAAKIAQVRQGTDLRDVLVFEDASLGEIEVDHDYSDKHKPKAGGYLVVYDDGYMSWSPAKAFEEGYTRI